MFGYITVNKPELKIKEFEMYQSYYCGLCKKIKEEHGVLGRIGLSYDMNFLHMLLTGLYEPSDTKIKEGCVAHPFEKRTMRTNSVTEYAADMNVLLMYYKCEDDWIDERKISKAMYMKLLSKARKKIAKKYPDIVSKVEETLHKMNQIEKSGHRDVDEMASLSGKMLGTVFSYTDDMWKEDLYKLGYYLGKFIYICDAYEDIEEDIAKDRYNPLLLVYNEPGFEENCKEIMTIIMAECCKVFETLPILENIDILRNILYSGVWNRYEMTYQKRRADIEKK